MELFYCGNQWGYTPIGNVTNIPAGYCNPPTGLKTTIQNQFVTFSWVPPHDYESFHLEYQKPGGAWTQIIVVGSNYLVELEPNTTYEWRVRTVCNSAASRFSLYATGTNFITQNAIQSCTPVSTVGIANMGTYYRATWFSTGAAYYKVYICPDQSDCGIYHTTTKLYFDMFDLAAGSNYRVRVVAVCHDGKEALTSPWTNFTVSNTTCYPPVNLTTIISSTSVVASWLPNPLSPLGVLYNVYLDGILYASNYSGLSIAITLLTPNTAYKIDVRANCEAGFSTAATVNIKTIKTPCDCTATVTISNIIETGFLITLGSACAPGSVADHFEIVLNNSAPIVLAPGVVTHSVTNLAPGTTVNVKARIVCANGEYSQYVTAVAVTLQGCGAVTGLTMNLAGNNINVAWTPLSNAQRYDVEVLIGGISQGVVNTNVANFTIQNIIRGVEYKIKVTPVCMVYGTLTPGTTTEVSNTYAKSSCSPYQINAVAWFSPTQIKVTVGMVHTPGVPYTGRGRLVAYTLPNTVVSELIFNTPGDYILSGLVQGTVYKLAAYDIFNSNSSHDPFADGCTINPQDYTHNACGSPAADTIVLSHLSATTLQVSFSVPWWTTNETTFKIQWKYDGIDYSAPVVATIAALPFIITVPGYARYKVKITPVCDGVDLAPIESKFSCPAITSVQTVASGTTLNGTITPALLGNYVYELTLTALGAGSIIRNINTPTFTIPNLQPGFIYSGVLKLLCNENPNEYSPSINFLFKLSSSSGINNCPPAQFEAIIQDCGSGTGGGGALRCDLEPMEFDVLSFYFTPLSSDPANSVFFEGTMQINQTANLYDILLVPGGILAKITGSACLPATTVVAVFEIIQGADSIIDASATIAIDGTITANGSYVADGGSILMVRVRASYLKA